jgi:hypothetical protein
MEGEDTWGPSRGRGYSHVPVEGLACQDMALGFIL